MHPWNVLVKLGPPYIEEQCRAGKAFRVGPNWNGETLYCDCSKCRRAMKIIDNLQKIEAGTNGLVQQMEDLQRQCNAIAKERNDLLDKMSGYRSEGHKEGYKLGKTDGYLEGKKKGWEERDKESNSDYLKGYDQGIKDRSKDVEEQKQIVRNHEATAHRRISTIRAQADTIIDLRNKLKEEKKGWEERDKESNSDYLKGYDQGIKDRSKDVEEQKQIVRNHEATIRAQADTIIDLRNKLKEVSDSREYLSDALKAANDKYETLKAQKITLDPTPQQVARFLGKFGISCMPKDGSFEPIKLRVELACGTILELMQRGF